MSKYWFIGLLASVVFGLVGIGFVSRAGDTREAVQPQVDFSGKTVLVFSRTDPHAFTALTNVTVKRLGDSVYLVGKVANSSGQRLRPTGVTLWLPLGDVGEIAEFDTMDELKKVIRFEK
jgi:hypothetical protein